ncbi:MAG: tryptophan 7-halogenase [Bryobacteraceae bacterium]
MRTADCDVTVMGGGLAGLAACIHLANAGLQVVCVEPEARGRQPVGESLDWSSPGLLEGLGFSLEDLIASGASTYKRGVTLQLADGSGRKYMPRPFLGRPPFHVELRTLHVDRVRLDQDLEKRALDLGVNLVRDQVTRVESEGERIMVAETALGRRLTSPWYIDASGSHASLLARHFHLPVESYGLFKVAFWTYFEAPLSQEGTTVYVRAENNAYLDWIWEIPITPTAVSVGYIVSGEAVKQMRQQGLGSEEIFTMQLNRFSRFEALLRNGSRCPLRTTSFQCRTFKNVSGPNWIIVGEAASMVDPITSNGVTSALRHAAEASALIVEARGERELPAGARTLYNSRVLYMGTFFNSGIEKFIYARPVRDRIGIRKAATAYVGAAWSINALYSRFRPRGPLKTWAFGVFLDVLKLAASIFSRMCSVLGHPAHRRPGAPAES